MLVINAKLVADQVLKALEGAERQAAFALAKGMTDTIKSVREAEKAEMRRAFQAPTPFTMNSLYLRAATKSRLEAITWLKSTPGRAHYLMPQIEGGNRPLKRFEKRLVMNGYMRPDQRAVPAAGAKLDAYGNMSRGQVVQILSQLRTAVVSGDFSNASNSKRSKAKRQAMAYFVSHGAGSRRHGFQGTRGKGQMYDQHLPAGVWARYQFAWGSAVKPVLIFVNRANYTKRWDFYGVAQRVIDQELQGNVAAAVREALRTARLAVQGGLF